MMKCWNCKGSFDVTGKGANIFVFQFANEEDKKRIVQRAPWFIFNCHLVLKEWPPHLSWEQVDLGKTCLWIQVHGLPLHHMNVVNAKLIGDSFVGLLDCQISTEKVLNPKIYIRFKVALWVDKPLLTGFDMLTDDLQKPWVRFKYELLLECFWYCRRLGHAINRCHFKGPSDRAPVYDIPEKGFGLWLQVDAPPVSDLQPQSLASLEKASPVTGKRRRESKKENNKIVWRPLEKPLVINQESSRVSVGANVAKILAATKERLEKIVGSLRGSDDNYAEYEPPVKKDGYSPSWKYKRGGPSTAPLTPISYFLPVSPGTKNIDATGPSIIPRAVAGTYCDNDWALEQAIEQRPVPQLMAPTGHKWKKQARASSMNEPVSAPTLPSSEASEEIKEWFMTCVYAPPNRSDRLLFWDVLKDLQPVGEAWLLMGDFNAIFLEKEKSGGRQPRLSQLFDFSSFLTSMELMDLDFKGSPFTWTNRRIGDDAITARIDRGSRMGLHHTWLITVQNHLQAPVN
ncbi:hypothetical protein Tsubulata_050868 [Turnera subulata]|uniref:DUF4283 domain-containing protein n=1 Tax=Turnera subulata TaxID=218843 RepID=A0A9Q0G267_9ROSI|nr:hypothetical protein Tsubulata_050868 [Turnera subulata]